MPILKGFESVRMIHQITSPHIAPSRLSQAEMLLSFHKLPSHCSGTPRAQIALAAPLARPLAIRKNGVAKRSGRMGVLEAQGVR